MSLALDGTYYPVCDGGGAGEDSCELLGAPDASSISASSDQASTGNSQGTIPCFYRTNRGDTYTYTTSCPGWCYINTYIDCPSNTLVPS